MKKYLAAVLAITLCIGMAFMGNIVEAGARETKKTDVDWLVAEGILQKKVFPEIDKIRKTPDRKITREEYLTLLIRAAGLSRNQKAYQKMDSREKKNISKKCRGYLGKAEQLGILDCDGKPVDPKKVLTKADAAYYLGKLTGAAYYTPLAYKDCQKVSDAGIYIKGLLAADVIPARNGTHYQPGKKLSWREAAGYLRKAEKQGLFSAKTISVYGGTFLEEKEENRLLCPCGITAASDGSIYVADKGSNTIKRYENGTMRIIAGKYTGKDAYGEETGGYRDDLAASAIFNHPEDLCITEDGTIFVSDTDNHVIRRIKDGKVTTFAGSGKMGYADGNGGQASFFEPRGIACDEEGNLYVADSGNNCIRKISKEKEVTTFVGSDKEGCKEGRGKEAAFSYPTDVIYEGETWYVVDSGNQRICRIKGDAQPEVTTVAGGGHGIFDKHSRVMSEFQDGRGKEAGFFSPYAIAADGKGNLYVTEASSGRIRKISEKGYVTTIAGFSKPVWKKASQTITNPCGILCTDGKILVTDRFQSVILQM